VWGGGRGIMKVKTAVPYTDEGGKGGGGGRGAPSRLLVDARISIFTVY
jgi:hypothetical protein